MPLDTVTPQWHWGPGSRRVWRRVPPRLAQGPARPARAAPEPRLVTDLGGHGNADAADMIMTQIRDIRPWLRGEGPGVRQPERWVTMPARESYGPNSGG